MRRFATLSCLSLALAAAAAARAAEAVTLEGEVVDMSCYLSRGASGTEHAECAERCIASSHTAGFRAGDGTLYLLLRSQDSPPPAEMVAGLAGRPVVVEGTATERDGFKAFRLAAVRPADGVSRP